MTIENYTQDPEPKTGENQSSDIKKLHQTIECMDGLSQSAFEHIGLLANLALRSMELPGTYKPCSLDDIADAFKIIRTVAEIAMNDINATAENVGCHFDDKYAMERSRARINAARQSIRSNVGAEVQR